MAVVSIPTPLRAHTDGLGHVEATGTTVREILTAVAERYPELRSRIFDGDEVRPFINVYVNNEDIRFLDDLDTPVAGEDAVDIIPSIAGG